MAIQFQQLGAGDVDVLVERLVAWHRREGVSLDLAFARREARRILSDNHGWHAWLIALEGRMVGYLMLRFRNGRLFEAPRASLAALYVEPEARNRQIGPQARRFLLDLSRWLNVNLFECDVLDEGRHAPVFSLSVAHGPRWLDSFPRQATA